ncbi:hypothetical protein GC093_13290 [Paenibacillus sp. LMG 31456]|uniref:Uncharacterized protein n=1 Tax=Paenibacillus foliorum TaxID=2654974 RepID=A0A972GPU4_9BACL|nr:hypothetical protein [Paenibacillus foliorum]
MIKWSKISSILGITAGIISMILWCIFSFVNPYSNRFEPDAALITFIMLCLPACLAILSAILQQRALMIVSFIWSIPVSLYFTLTPGIFALFGVNSLAYLITFLLMRANK